MKAADLERATALAEARAQNVAMRDRLAAGERLVLSMGSATGKTSEIVMAKAWLDGVRRDLIAGFSQRIAENDAALVAIGVEP
ncbi:hypothetical protein [Mesorhizobium sp.]|uniref:hypothetical protein n=1 Tax=Mesorhizobium sp. TaxID=1871066 RepID=UPI0011F9879C|nr:hypothetical protein [Mesorhizobium sp.]TIX28264.1 MAG: hypothetical protein E5V35_02675 [Mesorhizobium sp.]